MKIRRPKVTGKAANASAPRPGDILLFYNAIGLSRLITWLTKSPFYHAAIYEGNGFVVEARLRGVVRVHLKEIGEDFVVIPAPQNKGEEALAWASQQIGDDYAVWGAAAIAIDRLFLNLHFNRTTNHNRFTCGGLIASAFLQVGVDLFPQCSPDEIVPGDFARLIQA